MTKAGLRKVVITQRFFDEQSLAYLHSEGCAVTIAELPPGLGDGDVPDESLLRWLNDASGWIVGHARVTRELLAARPGLEVVSRRGVGYDRIDLAAVHDLGRVATIAAGGNDAAVADQTVGLMLAVGRRFREGQANLHQGSWTIPLGVDLYRKTVGIVGLGRIGFSVMKRLRGFDCRILVHTPRHNAHLAHLHGFEYTDLSTLFSQSDYLTLHAPLSAETRFLVCEQTIRQMKPTLIVINTARGGLIEDRDLLAALKNKQLGGAGLDVFVSEADQSYKDVTADLVALPNVIALPHAGASTREALDRTNMIAARCVVAVLNNHALPPECVVADGRRPPPPRSLMP
jgi:D-3-phosphoglycerate dehydrogenase